MKIYTPEARSEPDLHQINSLPQVTGIRLILRSLSFAKLCVMLETCKHHLMSLYVERLYVDKLTGEGQELHLPRLEKLSIHHCPGLTDTGLGALLQMAGQNLTDLNLSYIQCTGNGLAGLALHLPRLEKLMIDNCYNFTDIGLRALLQMAGQNLTDLTLSYFQCTGNGLAGLALHLPRLEKLKIYYCLRLTDTGLGALLQMAGQNLTDLTLSYFQCTGNGLAGLALHLPRLEKLSIHQFWPD